MKDYELIIKECRDLLTHLPSAEAHRQYLNSRLNKDTQEKFGFGYFPSGQEVNLLVERVGADTLKQLSLLFTKTIQDSAFPRQVNFNFFEHQPLVMPYRDVYGNVIALVGRSILSEEDRRTQLVEKYKNTQFAKGDHLFGLYEAKYDILRKGFVYIVEGQFDVIKSFEKGLTNVVALGSSHLTGYQLSLLCRYTDNILLLLDNDAAGEKGRREIFDKYSRYANFQNVYLPDGYKDIDEYLKDHDVHSMSLLTKQVMSYGGA